MPKLSKTVVDADLRARIFDDIMTRENIAIDFERINDRQYGCILVDLNGVERYVRLGAIVAEEREDKTARQLMEEEKKQYQDKQAEKAEKAKKNAEKAAKDKAARAKKKEEEADNYTKEYKPHELTDMLN